VPLAVSNVTDAECVTEWFIEKTTLVLKMDILVGLAILLVQLALVTRQYHCGKNHISPEENEW
jgi:hypothetical protein